MRQISAQQRLGAVASAMAQTARVQMRTPPGDWAPSLRDLPTAFAGLAILGAMDLQSCGVECARRSALQ